MSVYIHAAVRLAASAGVAAMLVLAAGPAGATQSSPDVASLTARIAADQVQIRKLQAELSSAQDAEENAEEDHGNLVRVAGLFGESDEEKAERARQQQHEQAQDSSIATLNQRVSDLEETLRRLTGQMEQLDHRVSEFNDRITRMQKDFDYKLCTLSAQQLGASNGAPDQGALPCGGQQTGSQLGPLPPSDTPPASGAPQRLAPPPGILGTLPQNAVTGTPQDGPPGQPNQFASVDTRGQFDAAMSLLAKAQYDEARAAFRTFADSYPRDDLAPQAIYWVGDIAYVQKDYADASRAFAEELKKYPAGPRAPESMLKLGQSLIAMNEKKEGCLALGALPGKYPGASKAVTAQALATRHTAGCR
jgi:tol-pal system protein YbgF